MRQRVPFQIQTPFGCSYSKYEFHFDCQSNFENIERIWVDFLKTLEEFELFSQNFNIILTKFNLYLVKVCPYFYLQKCLA